MAMNANVNPGHVQAQPKIDLTVWFARYGTLFSLAVLLVVFSFSRADVFPTVNNLLNIMNQISILGTMAFRLTVCLVMGLFDLSIAAMATLGGYVATFLLVQYPEAIGVPITHSSGNRRLHRSHQWPHRQLSRHFCLHRDTSDRINNHGRYARHF
jgi:ABC-type xylose transport system permease subunit